MSAEKPTFVEMRQTSDPDTVHVAQVTRTGSRLKGLIIGATYTADVFPAIKGFDTQTGKDNLYSDTNHVSRKALGRHRTERSARQATQRVLASQPSLTRVYH